MTITICVCAVVILGVNVIAAILIGNHPADIGCITVLILIAVNGITKTVRIGLRVDISVCIHQGIHTLGCRHSKQCLQFFLICIRKTAAL